MEKKKLMEEKIAKMRQQNEAMENKKKWVVTSKSFHDFDSEINLNVTNKSTRLGKVKAESQNKTKTSGQEMAAYSWFATIGTVNL